MQGKIVGYVTVGTNDLDRARKFYNELLAELGGVEMTLSERFCFWNVAGGQTVFSVFIPYDEAEATPGNGAMVGFPAEDEAQVRRLYEKALALGGTDEGAPGHRMETFYAAYVRDLDGNKLVFYHTDM